MRPAVRADDEKLRRGSRCVLLQRVGRAADEEHLSGRVPGAGAYVRSFPGEVPFGFVAFG
jgi:hypothetical protein